jgi:hypothetical protein
MKEKIKEIFLKFESDIDNGSGIPDKCIDRIDYDDLSEELVKLFSIHVVSGMLPCKYDELPEAIKHQLLIKHTHAELVDGEKIVYEEQAVLELLKFVSEGNYR